MKSCEHYPEVEVHIHLGIHRQVNASLHTFLCLNASFSTNDEVTREQRQRNAKYFFRTLLNLYKFYAKLIYLNINQQNIS